jgi:crotonobetaine/carnitine-CoA ligase
MNEAVAVERDDLLPHAVARLAQAAPDRVFINHVDGTDTTYGEFQQRSMRWAGALRSLGVEAGDKVLSMQPNGVAAYETWNGLAWLGAIEVGLNGAYRGTMLRYTANASNARVLVIAERYLPALAEVAGELDTLETVVVPEVTARLPELPQRVVTLADIDVGIDESTLRGPEPRDVACIIWTSGTTGPSKGVLVPWGLLSHSSKLYRANFLTVDDRLYHYWPPHHLSGKSVFNMAVLGDAAAVLREAFSPSSFWSDVRHHGVTHACVAGPGLRMLLAAPPDNDDVDNPLRTVVCGPLVPEVPAFMERFGIQGCGTMYGMTEIGFALLSDGYALPDLVSCGRVQAGYRIRLLDGDGVDITTGTVGELVLQGEPPWITNLGYDGMPDATAAAWQAGWFHTGDAFRADDHGNLWFVDRMKDTIRRRGENISSFEVELHVNEHPAVLESAAVAVPSELGEDEIKVVVVARPDAVLTAAALIEWLTPRMASFMVPRYVEFVTALPKTEATLRTRKALLRDAVGPPMRDGGAPGPAGLKSVTAN